MKKKLRLTSFLNFILLCKSLILNHFYEYEQRNIERKKIVILSIPSSLYYSCIQSSIRLNMYASILGLDDSCSAFA